VVVAIIAAPLVEVVLRSFQKEVGLTGSAWSTANFRALNTSEILTAARNSVIIAAGSMAVATVLGGGLAWLVTRTDLPFRRTFTLLNLIPFFLSPLIGSIAWTYLGDPRAGLLNQFARSIGLTHGSLFSVYSLYGMVIVLGLFLTPFAMLMCSASFRQMDTSLEHAAQASGAGTWRTALRVTLPLAGPTILATAILTFVMSIEDLSVPLVLGYSSGIKTLPTEIYQSVQNFPPNYNFGAAIGVVMMVITAICLYFQRRAVRDRGYVTVGGRASQQAALRLGHGRWLALSVQILYLLIAALLPLAVLVVVAFSARWTGRIDLGDLTTKNFAALFASGSQLKTALRNSLILSSLAAVVVVAVSIVVVYALERARITGRRLLEVGLTVPVAVPGLVLGVGLLTLLLHSPVYGTLWIIGIAYVVRYLPVAQRSVSAAFGSVHTELEEAARISGAAWFAYMRRVLVPLLRPGLFAGLLLTFLTFMRELPMSVLLQRTGTQTLSVALFNTVSFDAPGQAAAFTLLQTAVLLVIAGAFLGVTNRRGDNVARMAVGL
jgi:iron(III) transport system permease protein